MNNASPTKTWAAYIARVGATPLPPAVAQKTRLHLLDTMASMIDGLDLAAGRRALAFAKSVGGPPTSAVPGSGLATDPVNAAFVGAMAAHGDETDDSHLGGRFHPGCAVVPAALAVAQSQRSSGRELLRSIAAGYDLGARSTIALGYTSSRSGTHSTHCLGANFGAAAAAGALAGLGPTECESLLSYATQQASGLAYWERDPDHIEKAFDFGGMAARNGAFAALFVASGATGVPESLTGVRSYLSSFGQDPRQDALVEGLGERFEIMTANIKKWGVGSPCQAVLDSVQALIESHRLPASEIARIRVVMPDDRMPIVDNSPMPNICAQHLVALALLDQGTTNSAIRDHARMGDPGVLALRRLVELVPSRELTLARPARQAIVEIETADGRTVSHHTRAVLGTPDNPMSEIQVRAKSVELMEGRLGRRGANRLAEAISRIDMIGDVNELAALWTPVAGHRHGM